MDLITIIVIIIVALILAGFAIMGWKKGFLKMFISTMSLIVTLILASVLVTPVSNYLMEHTTWEQNLEHKIEQVIWKTSDTSKDTTSGETQEEALKDLSLPGIIEGLLIEHNNPEDYIKLGVNSFKDYVTKTVSQYIFRICVYIAIAIIIYLIFRLLLALSKLLKKIPIVNGFNKFIGLILGLLQALLILWVLALIVSAISQTELGISIIKIIEQSKFLSLIYNNNLLLELAKSIIS